MMIFNVLGGHRSGLRIMRRGEERISNLLATCFFVDSISCLAPDIGRQVMGQRRREREREKFDSLLVVVATTTTAPPAPANSSDRDAKPSEGRERESRRHSA